MQYMTTLLMAKTYIEAAQLKYKMVLDMKSVGKVVESL